MQPASAKEKAMNENPPPLPCLAEILKDNPAWLDEAVNTAEASRITGIPVCTLHTWRSRGAGPPFLKLGSKSVRYQRRALFEWMAVHRRRNTADKGNGHG
jgi:predicted DNA-binding transcriptional regulator AlpA